MYNFKFQTGSNLKYKIIKVEPVDHRMTVQNQQSESSEQQFQFNSLTLGAVWLMALKVKLSLMRLKIKYPIYWNEFVLLPVAVDRLQCSSDELSSGCSDIQKTSFLKQAHALEFKALPHRWRVSVGGRSMRLKKATPSTVKLQPPASSHTNFSHLTTWGCQTEDDKWK